MTQVVSVLFPIPFSKTFTYKAPYALTPGTFVLCPWGGREKIGVVWHESLGETQQKDKKDFVLKDIQHIYAIPPLSKQFCAFLSCMALYTVTPLGLIVKMALPPRDVFKEQHKEHPKKQQRALNSFKNEVKEAEIKSFSIHQQKAIDALNAHMDACAFSTCLIDGLTGSGKTEVFLEAANRALEKGQQVLFLLPEISLTPHLAERFYHRFGFHGALWHSDLTPAMRRNIWQGVASGDIKAVIGARSSLFLPFKDLGFIVVDEEHSHAYKQEQGIIYHARDMAVLRAKFEGCFIALVSATPSLETWYNVTQGRYQICTLPHRHKGAMLPDVTLIDRRQENKQERLSPWISPRLIQAITETVERGEQVLLFLNRRGYAPLTLCHTCGDKLACKYCSTWLVFHKKQGFLTCHQCGYKQSMPPHCPTCLTDSYSPCGPGVERLQEDIEKLFPYFTCAVITSDTMSSPKRLQETLKCIEDNTIHIIIGTQMMAKGHHFPNLTLVGIMDADMSLMNSDVRAYEKTFQLLHQVAGRAGRDTKPGFVYVQTYTPDHPLFDILQRHDRDGFMALEQQQRKEANLPPFTRMAALIVSSRKEDDLIEFCKKFARNRPSHSKVTVLGPAPAPLYQRQSKYRYRFLLECPKTVNIQNYIQTWLQKSSIPYTVHITVDIDPYTFF